MRRHEFSEQNEKHDFDICRRGGLQSRHCFWTFFLKIPQEDVSLPNGGPTQSKNMPTLPQNPLGLGKCCRLLATAQWEGLGAAANGSGSRCFLSGRPSSRSSPQGATLNSAGCSTGQTRRHPKADTVDKPDARDLFS